MSIDVIVLAAGQGSRMKSALPKVLHPIAGKPMLAHVLDATSLLNKASVNVVVGHGASHIKEAFHQREEIQWAFQDEQKGTGHAVKVAIDHISIKGTTLILYGDVPLIKSSTLKKLTDLSKPDQLGLLTVTLKDSNGYGRIVRNATGLVTSIVEDKDASESQKTIKEVNTGIMAVDNDLLRQWLPLLSNDNAQAEYYLTDIIAMAVAQKIAVATIQPESEQECYGVNTRGQQQALERWYQIQQAEHLMNQGVTVLDAARLDVRGNVSVGRDVVIDANVLLDGDVELGDGVVIASNCIIKNSKISAGTKIEAFSHIDGAVVAENCIVGPYARLRPGAMLHDGSKVGNFCEVKKSIIGSGSKVNHLTYIGDANIGKNTNIGAGTITCNYDGVNKFITNIGNDVFVGSNTSLVAPVNLEDGSTIAAGSTITNDVSIDDLAVARNKQRNIKNWKRPKKT
jgi:bifunctional UDP-N-acetylglucosamine pyrophosphorylase/glucosamine-1-phosphate N-acetyltransferase